MKAKEGISRRDFIRSLALAGVSVSSLAGCVSSGGQRVGPNAGKLVQAPGDGKSTVVIARSDELSKPDRTTIKRMLDIAVPQALAGSITDHGSVSADSVFWVGKSGFAKQRATVAWRTLFKPNDTIGIKVNCISPIVSSHPQLAWAIADSLIMAGIPAEQIIIWDREDRELVAAGYPLNISGSGIKCYGTKPRIGYGRDLIVTGSVGSRLSKILSRQCTATVNVPVLKDHNIAGLSLGLKNYFGAIENPNKFHGRNCDPYVADLNMNPHVREKNKLIICDAITVLYEGGPTDCRPRHMWNYNGLIIGTDPVAVDQIGLMLLEEKRVSAGLPPLAAAGRPVKYITTAADPDHRLGVKDPEKIRVVELQL